MNRILPIRAFTDNYIWTIYDNNSKNVFIVDPGDAAPVISFLKQNNLALGGILLTHHHRDHSGGIAELCEFAGEIPVYASYKSAIPYVTHKIKENDVISLGDLSLQALEIPGHTLDHTAYYGDKILFSGDTLFSAGCGKVFEGTPQQMFASLQKLYQLDEQTKIYCGHEYTLANLQFAKYIEPHNPHIATKITAIKNAVCTLPGLLHEEKTINPFLRCDQTDVVAAVEKHFGKKLNSSVEVFSYLRDWKNNFT